MAEFKVGDRVGIYSGGYAERFNMSRHGYGAVESISSSGKIVVRTDSGELVRFTSRGIMWGDSDRSSRWSDNRTRIEAEDCVRMMEAEKQADDRRRDVVRECLEAVERIRDMCSALDEEQCAEIEKATARLKEIANG